jgi:hypothetical protein
MNQLLKKEGHFLRFFVHASRAQQIGLCKIMDKSQMNVLVQIIYNILMGNRTLPKADKLKVQRHKAAIRKFVSKGLSLKQRKKLLIQKLLYINILLRSVRKEI